MSGDRTVVYVADHGLVKVQDGINYRYERVTLASGSCARSWGLT